MAHLEQVKESGTVKGTAPHLASAGGGLNWAALRNCEASGNYQTNTGNGYFGAYQANISFWRTYGDGSAARPDLASPASQDAMAQRAYAARGASPWPNCGKLL